MQILVADIGYLSCTRQLGVKILHTLPGLVRDVAADKTVM